MSTLDFALHYASLGFGVIPLHTPVLHQNIYICSCNNLYCKSIGKHPRTMTGLKAASKDPVQIRNWFESYFTNANLGIVTGETSGLIVLDIDTAHNGLESLRQLEQQYWQLPETVKVKTGGGFHYLFQYPGFTIKNSAGRLGAGLDIRGDGGYIVAPPSLHASGRRYKWLSPEIELAELPQWLLQLLLAKAQATETINQKPPLVATAENYQQPADSFPEGQRNNELAKLAGKMRRQGFSEEAIRQALLAENQIRCQPPLDDAEVGRIAASVARYQPHTAPATDAAAVPERLARSWAEMELTVFPSREQILHEIDRGETIQLIADPNAGKTTMTLNLALCMAIGQPFLPFCPFTIPRRVLIIDAETKPVRWQSDVRWMQRHFTPEQRELVRQNLFSINDAEICDEQLTLNTRTHLEVVVSEILRCQADFVILDTLSQLFTLKDENNNAEVAREVWRPLQKVARRTNSVIMVLHHTGKGSSDLIKEIYRGRGASASSGAARSIININQDSRIKELVTVHCAKIKGKIFEDVTLTLDATSRWFYQAMTLPQKAKTNYDIVVEFVVNHPVQPVKRSEIVAALKDQMTERRIEQALKEAVACGELENSRRALFSAPTPLYDQV
jgi:RecA-family ATPase